jgi:hypothetical protein
VSHLFEEKQFFYFCETKEEERMYMVSSIAGSGRKGYRDDIGMEAEFNYPCGIQISRDKKHLFVADGGNGCIRKISLADGTTSTIAGVPGESIITKVETFSLLKSSNW